MKNFYEIPEMEVVCFEVEDVIATSKGLEDGGANTEGGWGPPM